MLSLGISASRCLWRRKLLGSTFSFSSTATICARRLAPSEPSYRYNYNELPTDEVPNPEHLKFKLVDANVLEVNKEPPRKVRMLMRDYIEDALYNPNYGYFPKQATIFNLQTESFDFPSMKNSVEFQETVAEKYTRYGLNDQLWHTPTELFKPWYGQAVAQCLVSEYMPKYFPYEDFIIYEIGAGNGTLAMNILDYLQEAYPAVYDRTRYVIIEISAKMAESQRQRLTAAHPCVQVVNESIFRWKVREPAPCFFLAMEVVDNFGHDQVRYDLRTLKPYQAYVTIDEKGDFDTYYTAVTDPLIQSFVDMRKQLSHPLPISKLLQKSKILRKAYTSLPFSPNLSKPEYIPTRLLSLLQKLREHFPRHRLLLSDFASLTDTIPGTNAPVVQTRYHGFTIPTSTIYVRHGAFDIFFPTDFEHLRDMYEFMLAQPSYFRSSQSGLPLPSRSTPLTSNALSLSLGANFFSSRHSSTRRTPLDGVTSATGLPVGERKSSVFKHREFLETYADTTKTRLRNGENPMLEFYENAKVLF